MAAPAKAAPAKTATVTIPSSVAVPAKTAASPTAAATPVAAAAAVSVVAATISRGAASAKSLLHVRVIEAKNLTAADSNGRSDPYLNFKIGSKSGKSKTIDKTLHPVWQGPTVRDAEFTFEIKADLSEPLLIECMDHDVASKDDFLGLLTFPLHVDLRASNTWVGWRSFTEKKGGPTDAGSAFVAIVLEPTPADLVTTGAAVETRRAALLSAAIRAQQSIEEKGASIRICTGTWNVGNKPPSESKTFATWLVAGADIYVVGTQECEYSARKGGSVQADFELTISEHLNSGEEKTPPYAVVRSHKLSEMRIFVFARQALIPRINRIEVGTEATGVADVVGNKGGVAVTFHVDDLSLVFVNSHLAAHQHKTEGRNSDVKQIIEGIFFGDDKFDVLNQFDHVFWMGDLNYRVNLAAPGGEKKEADAALHASMVRDIGEGKLRPLFEGPAGEDQLTTERKSGRVFAGFSEGTPYHFRPTFKVKRGQVAPEYNEKRLPAWCDRVLWKSAAGHDVKQVAYGSAEGVVSSDHKPVYAIFDVLTHRLATAFDDSLGAAHITIKGMKAHGIPAGDVSGTSDAYLTFHGPFLTKSVKTSTKSSTLAPEWGDELSIAGKTLPLTFNRRARLATQTLGVKLYDADATKDNFLAFANIPLGGAISGAEYRFTVDFTKGGLPAGVLEGVLQIVWGAVGVAPAKR